MKFDELEDSLDHFRCPECLGGGTCNDADIHDISYNMWECEACKGTGWKDGKVYRLTHLQPAPNTDWCIGCTPDNCTGECGQAKVETQEFYN